MTGSLSSSHSSGSTSSFSSSSSQQQHRTSNRRRTRRTAAATATLLLSSTSYLQSALAAPQPQLLAGTHRILTPDAAVSSPTTLATAGSAVADANLMSELGAMPVVAATPSSSLAGVSAVPSAAATAFFSSSAAPASSALPSASASSGGLAGLPAASAAQYGASEALSQIFGQEIQQQIGQAIASLQSAASSNSTLNGTSATSGTTVAQDSLLAGTGVDAQTQSFAQAIKAAVASAVASVVASIDNSATVKSTPSNTAAAISASLLASTVSPPSISLPSSSAAATALPTTVVQPLAQASTLAQPAVASAALSALSASSEKVLPATSNVETAAPQDLYAPGGVLRRNLRRSSSSFPVAKQVVQEGVYGESEKRWLLRRWWEKRSLDQRALQQNGSSAPMIATSSISSEEAMPSVYVAFATVTVTETQAPSSSASSTQASSEKRSSSSSIPSIVIGAPTIARGGAEFTPTPFSGSVTSIGYSTVSPVLAAAHSVVPSAHVSIGSAEAASLASARNAAVASFSAKASSQSAQPTLVGGGTLGSLTGTNGGPAPAANDAVSVSASTSKSSASSQTKASSSSQPAATVSSGSALGSLTGTNGGFVGNASAPSPAGDNIVSDIIDSLPTAVSSASTKSSSAIKSSSTTVSKSTSSSVTKASSSSVSKSTSTPASTAVPQPAADSTSQVLIGYWPDWTAATLPPESIDFTKYDIVYYAFALPTSTFGLEYNYGDSSLLKRLVKAAHAGGSKVILSIGGWGGSTYFSPAVRTDATRQQFITSILAQVKATGIDGLDFDWEYPYGVGAGNNQLDASDTANFQTFLQQLRAQMPSPKLMSAAVAHQPWTASNGRPVGSVARAASALDYIMIMNYDVWGSSSTPGPNAPLANLCGNSTQPAASAAAAVKQWSAAGMPRSKMILGVPAYGYVSTSSARSLIQRDQIGEEGHYLPSAHRKPDNYPDVPSGRAGRYDRRLLSTASQLAAKTLSEGQNNWNDLVSAGALKKSSTGSYVAGTGWTRKWDACSDTPFLYNGKQVITYDDPASISDKGEFARATGLAGVGIWSIDADTSDLAIASAAIAGMGL